MSTHDPFAELIGLIEPWVTLLDAQSQGDVELREAFFGEFCSATNDFAAGTQKAGLRGLSNVTVLLGRGLQERRGKPIEDDDVAQLTLWLSGVQSYLDAQLPDPAPLIEDLQQVSWIPKLAPPACAVLIERLREPAAHIDQCAAARAEAHEQAMAQEQVLLAEAPGSEAAEPEVASAALLDEESAFGAFDLGAEQEVDAFSFSDDALGADPIDFANAPAEPALGFHDDAQIDASSLLETATDEQAPSDGTSDNPSGDIWIATEEFQLVSETVQARLQPALLELQHADERALLPGYVEVCYQIELLGNAFGVLSLEQASHMCVHLNSVLAAPGNDTAERIRTCIPKLAQWVQRLVDYCAAPDRAEARAKLVMFVKAQEWIAPLNDMQMQALQSELDHVHVGVDPSLFAARKTIVLQEDMDLRPAEDVMPNVLQGMLLELPDNAHGLAENIAAYIQTGDPENIDNARRIAHTLKGDANTVGIRGIANLTHSLEDIFIEMAKNPGVPSAEFAELLTTASDCVSEMADHVMQRGAEPADALQVTQRVLDVANQLATGTSVDALNVQGVEITDDTDRLAHDHESALAVAERLAEIANTVPVAATLAQSGQTPDVPMLQVPADVLDRLLDFSSEALVLLRQIENQIKAVDEGQAEIERQRQEGVELLEELDRSVSLRGSALQSARGKGEEVDPLELDQYNELYTVTRRLIEVSADEQTARNTIERAARRLMDLANEQEKVQLELQDQIMRTRQVPVKEFVGRFQRAVRQTSKMLDKDVEFSVIGQDTLIDRVQMENLIDPLMHALRNAVDHGIENQSLRMTRGKARVGNIALSFQRDGRTVSVKIKDDGAGLNYDRIRAKAIERGFMSEEDKVSNDDLAQIILLPGFSTKDEVTQVSGRGIGLDVVYQRIQDLRGSLQISSQPSLGTAMDIRLPASMTSLYVALAQNQRGTFAIATDSIENFTLIEPEQISLVGSMLYALIDGKKLPMTDLDALVQGYRAELQIPEQTCIGALIRGVSGELQVGYVREVKEMRTVIVKDFGPYMRVFPGIRGGTILGDGAVAPVIDARELMRNTAYQPWSERDESYRRTLAQQKKLKVLIADDSLSVRRALEQLMRDNGFEVILARDGLEALGLVNATRPDLMLVDLEMPRMNGLELTSFVRKDAGMTNIPIIMITSRTSEKHKQLATEAGVNEILSKPYSEDVLLKLVQDYVAEKASMPNAA
jgi:chemotaxis protein histidine kinase CheA/ActR/RegA family two-component response regulator